MAEAKFAKLKFDDFFCQSENFPKSNVANNGWEGAKLGS